MRRKMFSILCISLLLAIPAGQLSAESSTIEDVRGRMDPAQITPLDQSNELADLEMTSRIREALAANSSLSRYAQNLIIVTTTDNRVILRGVVDSSDERELMGDVVKNVVGNRTVQLDLRVVQPSGN